MNKFEPIIKDLVEDEIYEVLDTDPSSRLATRL